tara:strand:+ start:3031 stop:4767 length:1737 start_codon:yes stop_codon:yes gene_type:complete
MSFNTGNAVPSTDAKDLSDNSENFDSAVNSQADTWQDRLQVTRDTVAGRIKKMGYAVPLLYAGGISFGVNDNVKTVDESATIYAPLPSALPFTTSGTWVGDDDAKFFVVQNGSSSGFGANVRSTNTGVSISAYANKVDGLYVVDSTTDNLYKFSSLDFTAEVTEDSASGYYVPPITDLTGASGAWVLASGTLTADASVIVGAGEKHTTLNSLFDALSNITSKNKNSMEVTLKAGFVMAEQILIYGANYGWVKISSIDAEVTVTRSAMTLSLGSFDNSIPVFGGIGSTLPVINVMFRMDTSGAPIARQDGLFVENGTAIILPGAGFQDFTEVGIYANSGSKITAEGTNCSGSGVYGYFAFKSSSINCQSATGNNCIQYGLYINRASQASANLATFNNAGINAVRVIRGSTLAWEDGVGTGAGQDGLHCLNSVAQCLRADVSNSGSSGINSYDSSQVDFRSGVALACGGIASLWAFRCGTIDADGATATGSLSATAAVLAQRASNINFQDGDCSGSTALYGIRSSESSRINAKNANAQKGGAPAASDCSVEFGGTINFDGGTGGTDTAVNAISSKGIIFQ